ncbi:hypothetical protein O181_037964 [Austropuccinia psidii MF-1]|uniref:Uncharacterized protein n=1 Tax=Austropuccinia psidii MF-1 TaxID=1389203 RepID=A0A9Q3HD44_9BASI|nr:hypothetical protein [Austropuccinia psidii MF-1]
MVPLTLDKPTPVKSTPPNPQLAATPSQSSQLKRYDWIPENIPPPPEIHGDFGNPRNIIDEPRRRNQANFTSNLQEGHGEQRQNPVERSHQ